MAPTVTYTFFDNPTKSNPPNCWSPDCWKARCTLNYKGVQYETEWLEYPDIRVRLSAMGLLSKGGIMPYTLPMLRVNITPDDGSEPQYKYLTDGADIVKYLADNHPSPPLSLDDATTQEVETLINTHLLNPFCGLVLVDTAEVLPERSNKYFHETRPLWMGMPAADFKAMKIREGAWQQLEDGIGELRKLLGKNSDKGPFVMGDQVSFGDMRIMGYLMWAKNGGPPGVFAKILEWGGPELERFIKAMEEKGVNSRATY